MESLGEAVIVVRTANRPEVLNRCIEAAVDGCLVAQAAFWIVLDDSGPEFHAASREVTRFWKRFGLRLAHVDQTVEAQIAESLPAAFRDAFLCLAARPAACPTTGGRNVGLLTAFAFDPRVVFLIDDDVVHRHEGNCFFHWCLGAQEARRFIAAPRKLGIRDTTYLRRLSTILGRPDWFEFISEAGFSAASEVWYSPANPLWKPVNPNSAAAITVSDERDVLSGELVGLCNTEAPWLPFPSEYNEDLNWGFLEAACHGTRLLKVGGVNVSHVPPAIGHAKPSAIISEIIGSAITRALRQIKPQGEHAIAMLDVDLPDVLASTLKQELIFLLEAQGAAGVRARACTVNSCAATLSKIAAVLADSARQLKSIDLRQVGSDWIRNMEERQRMFMALRRNRTVQWQIRRILLGASD